MGAPLALIKGLQLPALLGGAGAGQLAWKLDVIKRGMNHCELLIGGTGNSLDYKVE